MKSKRGAFIVLEGCDRVGKSTQAKKLTEELRKLNIRTASYAFPNRSTNIGQKINDFLTKQDNSIDKKKLHALFSENRREFEPEMRKLLSEGTTLIVDRYSFSGVAFSAANKLDKQWCWKKEWGLPKPDLVLFLKMSLDKAAARKDYGNEIYEKLDFQTKVLNEFLNMTDHTWQVIEVDNKDIETVHKEILCHVLKIVTNACYEPLHQF
ncbi:hypothetical protein PGB90_000899 [Kerria lacca]